jgi:hypothetical protein
VGKIGLGGIGGGSGGSKGGISSGIRTIEDRRRFEIKHVTHGVKSIANAKPDSASSHRGFSPENCRLG